MAHCCVRNCKNRSNQLRKNKTQLKWEASHGKISFHSVPTELQQRNKWLNELGLDHSNIPLDATVCSLHFHNKDIDRTSFSHIRLRPGAVPFGSTTRVEIEEPTSKQCKVLCKRSSSQENPTENFSAGPSTSKVELFSDQVSWEDSSLSPVTRFVTQETLTSPHLLKNTPQKKRLQISVLRVSSERSSNQKSSTEKFSAGPSTSKVKLSPHQVSWEESPSSPVSRYVTQGMSASPHLLENTPQKQRLQTSVLKVSCKRSSNQKNSTENFSAGPSSSKVEFSPHKVSWEDSPSPERQFVTQGTSTSPHLSEHTPRKKLLHTALHNTRKAYSKKIKTLQQKHRRYMKRVAKLKDVLDDLRKKNVLQEEQLDVLQDLELLLTSQYL